MADFEKAIANTFKAEGGFQSDPNDAANYVNKTLIGTNRGISAQGYYSFYKKVPTVDDMKNLTVDQAKLIFKGNYWDKIGGDYITNQSVAEMMFQYIIGSGASQISDIKDIANTTNDSKVLVSNDLPITKADCVFINGLNQEQYFTNLWNWRLNFYDVIVNSSIAQWEKWNNRKITDADALKYTKKKFLSGWRNRLSTHKFIA